MQELHRLEKLQCIKTMQKKDFLIILPLSVVFSEKPRLVVDPSRHINLYVKKRKVKLDSFDDFSFVVKKEIFSL